MKLILLTLLITLSLGCQKEHAHDHDHDHDHGHGHGHTHDAPNGGVLVDVENEFCHLEFLVDINIYIVKNTLLKNIINFLK